MNERDRYIYPHLSELLDAAAEQDQDGWTTESIEESILKWCRKYNGQYADEDVALAIRGCGIEPSWLDAAAKIVSEKHGGAPIYSSNMDPRDEALLDKRCGDDGLPFEL